MAEITKTSRMASNTRLVDTNSIQSPPPENGPPPVSIFPEVEVTMATGSGTRLRNNKAATSDIRRNGEF